MFENIRQYYEKFVKIREEDWKLLENKLTVRQLRKGEFLTREGEPVNEVSFVEEGLLRMFYHRDGKEISAQFFYPGVYMSVYDSFLTRKPARINIDALTDSTVINLNYEAVQELYEYNMEFQKFGRLIAEAILISTQKRVMSLMLDDPETRYINLVNERPKVIQTIPQYMIASYLGVTPEGLSRIKKRIQESGRL